MRGAEGGGGTGIPLLPATGREVAAGRGMRLNLVTKERTMTPRSKLSLTVFALGLAGLVAQGCNDTRAPTAVDHVASLDAKPNDQFNEKFEFDPVTFPDETTGIIRAGSKNTGGGSESTHCGYYTPDDAYLGAFNSLEFASADPDEIEQFCLNHYNDRS